MHNMRLFHDALKNAKSQSELNLALQKHLTTFNISTYAFTYYSYYPNALNKLKYDFSSNNFAPWHKHYIAENYEEIDSTMEEVYQASMPIYWELQQQLRDAKSERERQMRLDSIAFGAEKGLCIPIHGPQEDFAILLLVQMRGEKCLMQWKNIQYDLFSSAYCYYTFLQKQLLKTQAPAVKHQLNKREVQCLSLLAKHYSTQAIAEALNITERTVNYHIQRLNKKLGTKNKHQSVAKALQHGIICL